MRYEKPEMVVNVLNMCEVVRTSLEQLPEGGDENITTGPNGWPR